MIAELWRQRALVFTLVKRDLKVRYKASALGFLWSFGRPLGLMLILWFVFSQIVRVDRVHQDLPYPLQLLAGLLPWMFLTGTLFEAQNAILANESIVKKVAVPTVAFPAATVLGNLVHTLLAFAVLFAMIAAAGAPVGWEVILLPVVLLIQTVLLLGLSLILSSLQVFYRDVGSISELAITMWFYATPIIYPVQMAREKLRDDGAEQLYWLYLLNPMTPLVCAYRRVLYGPLLREHGREIDDRTLLMGLAASALTACLLLAVGSALFRRLSRRFADEL